MIMAVDPLLGNRIEGDILRKIASFAGGNGRHRRASKNEYII